MDLDESFEKKKEGEIISNFKTMQRLIMLEPDPDSKAVVLTYGEDDELMFPQLELKLFLLPFSFQMIRQGPSIFFFYPFYKQLIQDGPPCVQTENTVF